LDAETKLATCLGELQKRGLTFAATAVFYEMGNIEFGRKQYKRAISYYRQASIQCRIGMDWGDDLFGKILISRAECHAAIGELGNADRLFKQGIQCMRKTGQQYNLAIALTSYGYVLKEMSNVSGARSTWSEAIFLFKKLGNQLSIRTLDTEIELLAQSK